jgi:glycerol-3-phosphate acyltransferase PlsY
MTSLDFGLVLFGYLFGSVSTAILVARAMGLPDPRTQGSKNPGATNVLRIGGKKAAAFTLLGDSLKGLLPVLAARAITEEPAVLAAVAFAAFIGHLFPVFFGFKGGKGVATAMGVLLGLSWPIALAVLVTWLFMAKVVRISSLSAITAALLAPLYTWLIDPQPAYLAMVGAMSTLLLLRHRSNIQKLLRGEEGRIGEKS